MKEAGAPGFPRRPALLVVSLLAIASLFLAPGIDPRSGSTAARFVAPTAAQSVSAGTPIAAPVASDTRRQLSDPLDGDPESREEPGEDPLDGDPLDGPLLVDDDAPPDQARLEIARSGRPGDQPPSLATYDDDPETIWTPAASAEEPWLWFDLGDERRLRGVRWLARGAGEITVAISNDRQRWRSFDVVDVRGGWDGITLADDARYVRLLLAPDEEGDLPSLAEVTVYGSERVRQNATDRADPRDENRRQRRQHGGAGQEVVETAQDTGKENRGGKGKGRIEISAEPGETRCKGKKARCEAKEGRVTVEEDCAGNGTCVIEVQADGGIAVCDASGGDAPRDRRDEERRRGAKGGRCEAVADGGTVTIGDINP